MTRPPLTLPEQLENVQPILRQRQSAIHPISQVLLQLRGDDPTRTFDTVRQQVLDWIAHRAGRALPDHAWTGAAFELEEVGAQRVAAVVLTKPRYWAARIDDADKTVAQRTWVTEIGVAESPDKSVLFGTRLTCVTRGRDQSYARSIPAFVRRVAQPGVAWLEHWPVRKEPWLISTEGDVDSLVRLLRAPRKVDVIVLSLPEDSVDPQDAVAPALDVHQRTWGVAHVAVITGPASFYPSDRLGKEFSVFRQAVRTYRPGFDPGRDEPYAHPLAMPLRIADWPNGGPVAYADFLINQSLARSVARSDAQESVPPFATIRQLAAQERLAAARQLVSSDKDLLEIAEDEIETLKAALADEKKTAAELLKAAEEERDAALAAADSANARAGAMRYRIEALDQSRHARDDEAEPEVIPDSLDEIQEWCANNLAGSVEVHNRAFQGLKKSQFSDIGLIYRALLLLRDFYVPMRRYGGQEGKEAFEAKCRDLGIVETPTFSGEKWGEEGDTYIVTVAGRPRLLERHLKKGGNTRDPRRCFRLYFFWDADSEQAIVGWLPSHLESRAT